MTSISNRLQSAFRGLLGRQTPVISPHRPPEMQAKFDLAQTTVHNRRHWANADSLAARAAMSPSVRSIVRKRSRHEFDNNSWYSGILRTAANHIIGCGPRLQVLTTNADANTRLEKAWMKWSRQVMLADKLRMMFETYWKDGEVFAMRTSRPSRWPISLDIRTFEAEQCAAPWIGQRMGDSNTDDGIRTAELALVGKRSPSTIKAAADPFASCTTATPDGHISKIETPALFISMRTDSCGFFPLSILSSVRIRLP